MQKKIDYSVKSTQTGNPDKLIHCVQQHAHKPYRRPIPTHQHQAFATIDAIIKQTPRPIHLDSCCGTGLSSQIIAQNNPNHWVIAIDQSEHRLNKCTHHTLANLRYVRANVIDFWRLIHAANWPVQRHTLFYPNPWPKAKHLKRRFYAHPTFQTLLQISPQLEVRSNWKRYLEEFALATHTIKPKATTQLSQLSIHTPQSAFETKYHRHEQACFQLMIILDQ